MERIKDIQKEIDKIKVELVMGSYNNGWLNEEYKKRLKKLEEELYTEISKNNGNSNILNS